MPLFPPLPCVLQSPFFTRTIVVIIIIPGFNRPLTLPAFCPSNLLQPSSFGPMTCHFRTFLPLRHIQPGTLTNFGIEIGTGGRSSNFCLASNVGSFTMGSGLSSSSGLTTEEGLTSQSSLPSISAAAGPATSSEDVLPRKLSEGNTDTTAVAGNAGADKYDGASAGGVSAGDDGASSLDDESAAALASLRHSSGGRKMLSVGNTDTTAVAGDAVADKYDGASVGGVSADAYGASR
jgi:hypothetical protein